jgi:hypothetical protein
MPIGALSIILKKRRVAAAVGGSAPVLAAQQASHVDGNTNLTMVAPSGIASGNTLIIIWCGFFNGLPATPSGWTLADSETGTTPINLSGAIYWKISDGTETDFDIVHGSAVTQSAIWLRITGAHASASVEVTSAAGASGWHPDCPSITPSWGSANNMWIAAFSHARSPSLRTVSSYPTGYTDNQTSVSNDDTVGGTDTGVVFATKAATATSDDPDAYVLNATANARAFTIAVRPAA